jgi:hypothetical protein
VKTPEPYETSEGTAVDLGTLYRYETKEGVRYILSAFREAGSPRAFFITRDQVHEQIDRLLDRVDASAASKPGVPGTKSKKWSGE